MSLSVFCQTKYQQFLVLYKAKDNNAMKQFIKDWEEYNREDPNLYLAASNYYFLAGVKNNVKSKSKDSNKSTNSSTENNTDVNNFEDDQFEYDSELMNKSIEYIYMGVIKFPNRLDLRLEKCQLFKVLKKYDSLTIELVNMINQSNTNKNNWLWSGNIDKKNAKSYMLNTITRYLNFYYKTEKNEILADMTLIGETAIQYYPNHEEILKLTSYGLNLRKEYNKAILYLTLVEKLRPYDLVIIKNLAISYRLKGDRINAIKYYNLIVKYGNKIDKTLANSALLLLERD